MSVQKIKNMLPNRKVVSFHKKAAHTGNIDFPKKENMDLSNTLLDLATLGICDELVGTKSSTFTILASSLIGKLPYLVGRKSNCYIPPSLF